jgi:peptidoglycan hydrolase-like protein with peptidoglycan-binding domain
LVILLIGLAAGGVFSGGGTRRPTKPLTTRTTPTTTQASAPTPTVPPGTLKLGEHGTTVKELQRALRSLGYAPGSIDGVFGPSTQRALIAFQTARHLTPDGVLGPATRAAMMSALRSRR